MNVQHMPELEWRYGYTGMWMAMVTLTVLLVLWCRRRTWL
jgi:magnesium transporter